MRLVHACTYDTGEKVSGDTVAEGALCSAIAYAIEEGEARYDIPCAGDRKYGGVHRDELVFCMPYSLGERVTQNLEKLVGDAGEYMVPPTLSWTPSMSPDFTVSEEELE
jgi:uncharacterized protein (DUF169 family)